VGEARRKAIGTVRASDHKERVYVNIPISLMNKARALYERLKDRQKSMQLPPVSFHMYLEMLLDLGITRMTQQLATEQEISLKKPPLIVTPSQAAREVVMADAVQAQLGGRYVGGRTPRHM
jgi:hypothetical protein